MSRVNRFERQQRNREKLKLSLSGTGLYVYRNNSHGTLMLPKPAADGKRHIGVNETFQGDSYFMDFVKRHELILVEVISEGNTMNAEKLILDQPDQVTTKGTVEHVVQPQPVKPLNETTPHDPTQGKDVLITEDPLDGVEIILG